MKRKLIYDRNGLRIYAYPDGSITIELWSLFGTDEPQAAVALENIDTDEMVVALRERTLGR